MNNKPQKLELTWMGKDEQQRLQPKGKNGKAQTG
jgi:hypothetical protein